MTDQYVQNRGWLGPRRHLTISGKALLNAADYNPCPVVGYRGIPNTRGLDGESGKHFRVTPENGFAQHFGLLCGPFMFSHEQSQHFFLSRWKRLPWDVAE